jgi:hypothetical protein
MYGKTKNAPSAGVGPPKAWAVQSMEGIPIPPSAVYSRSPKRSKAGHRHEIESIKCFSRLANTHAG